MLVEQPVPVMAAGAVDRAAMAGEEPAKQAQAVLDRLNSSLAAGDARALEDCFLASQAYWKDALALTYHLRTFTTPGVIAAGLLETRELRGATRDIALDGAQFIPATPVLVSNRFFKP